jgi:hypothetical protein
VFVHHDLNAWISVWLKFESLKNEFEKNFKKKAFTPSPLSFLPKPAQPFLLLFLSARVDFQAASLLLAHAAAHVGPTLSRLPAQHCAPSSFATSHWQVGPGRQAHPLPPAAGGRAPLIKAVGRFRPGQLLPRHQAALIECSDAPSLQSPF